MAEDTVRKRDWTLRVKVAGSAAEGREATEAALGEHAKRWEFVQVEPNGEDAETLEYQVRIRKRDDPQDFMVRFRATVGSAVEQADLEE
jgi:hypothetical protein